MSKDYKQKKVILFIVEGITDRDSLAYMLEEYLVPLQIRFKIVNGDITTKNGVTSSNVIKHIDKMVDQVTNQIIRRSDILRIVHLVDTDGCFVDDAMVKDCCKKLFYDEHCIHAVNKGAITARNKQKQMNLKRIMNEHQIHKIPYSVYYFSCNLEHVLHNDANVETNKKVELADSFADLYENDIEGFVEFLSDQSFSVKGTYQSSWEFIQIDGHSLQRYTNFGLFLDEYRNYECARIY